MSAPRSTSGVVDASTSRFRERCTNLAADMLAPTAAKAAQSAPNPKETTELMSRKPIAEKTEILTSGRTAVEKPEKEKEVSNAIGGEREKEAEEMELRCLKADFEEQCEDARKAVERLTHTFDSPHPTTSDSPQLSTTTTPSLAIDRNRLQRQQDAMNSSLDLEEVRGFDFSTPTTHDDNITPGNPTHHSVNNPNESYNNEDEEDLEEFEESGEEFEAEEEGEEDWQGGGLMAAKLRRSLGAGSASTSMSSVEWKGEGEREREREREREGEGEKEGGEEDVDKWMQCPKPRLYNDWLMREKM